MAFVYIATPYTMAVVRRQYIVWLKLIWSSLAINIANPILFLFAFGFGLGRFIDTIGGVSYLVYVVPGMVAYSAMFAASFETTIGSFSRFYMLRTWDATLATPVTFVRRSSVGLTEGHARRTQRSYSWLAVGRYSRVHWRADSAADNIRRLGRFRLLRPARDIAGARLRVFRLLLYLLGHADVHLLRRILRNRSVSLARTNYRLGTADDASGRHYPSPNGRSAP